MSDPLVDYVPTIHCPLPAISVKFDSGEGKGGLPSLLGRRGGGVVREENKKPHRGTNPP